MLEFTNWSERVKLHVDECYEYKDNLSKYCLYLHGYFAPLLEKRRADGQLIQGKLIYFLMIRLLGKITVNVCEYQKPGEYEGELNYKNN